MDKKEEWYFGVRKRKKYLKMQYKWSKMVSSGKKWWKVE